MVFIQLADLLNKSTRVHLRCLNAKIDLRRWQELSRKPMKYFDKFNKYKNQEPFNVQPAL